VPICADPAIARLAAPFAAYYSPVVRPPPAALVVGRARAKRRHFWLHTPRFRATDFRWQENVDGWDVI